MRRMLPTHSHEASHFSKIIVLVNPQVFNHGFPDAYRRTLFQRFSLYIQIGLKVKNVFHRFSNSEGQGFPRVVANGYYHTWKPGVYCSFKKAPIDGRDCAGLDGSKSFVA